MPLPSDEKVLKLSNDLIQMFDTLFGLHPGFRPAHAKGIMLSGKFTPTRDAALLSRAPHFNRASTPVTVRFSNSTGVPVIPDNDPNADPRGMAIRFNLAEHVHTDIVSHSTDGFPTHTGEEFLEFLRAVAASSDQTKPHPWPVEAFLGSHPAALAFVQAPKPAPSSFARDTYFGVTAMKFISASGESRYGRYRIIPEAGNDYVEAEALKAKQPDYLFKEIVDRVVKSPIRFKVAAQLANEGDVVDDATVHWPEERRIVDLGDIDLTAPITDNAAEQQKIIFDPIPRVDGIEPSADPLLELRAAVYLISGRRRRAAPPTN
ncbi:MAG TPA: catalase family peroxidase [Silvibacterium sp.]|nr:catalase family peroxidase [Silvibacterium sp.]